MAGEAAVEQAKVVVYRVDESSKSRRVSMYLRGDEISLGRLTANNSIVTMQAAGDYTLGSNIKGAKPLVLDLKPGQTYYVHASVSTSGTRVKMALAEVEEHVARVQWSVLDSAI